MKKLLKIELDGGWVLSRSGRDDMLPIDAIKAFAAERFKSNLKCEYADYAEVMYSVQGVDVEAVAKQILAFFMDKYSLIDAKGIIKITIGDVPEEEKKGDSISLDLDKKDGGDKNDNGESVQLGNKEIRIENGEIKVGPSTSTSQQPTNSGVKINQGLHEKALEKVDTLVGCDEFKSLIHEIASITPEIVRNKTFDVMNSQSYVFSINDGCGLTTYREILYSMLYAMNPVGTYDAKRYVKEVRITLPKDNREDPFEICYKMLDIKLNGSKNLLCVDITEWMDKVNSIEFKQFLKNLESYKALTTIVFRVPFVEKEVLDRIKFALNDMLFVKTVSIPPFTKEEIQIFAMKELSQYGFNSQDNAWDSFHERIVEEKSDGKFYGLNTIKKVVRELLYNKQLNNVKAGATDVTITEDDCKQLCSMPFEGTSGYDMLDNLIGSKPIRERIDEIIAQIELARKTSSLDAPCIHMRFTGNPGTGKTTVARIVGKILKEKGILRIGNFFEYAGRDFCGRYIGETAPKTASMCRDAYGSVLFIDEAYSLYKGEDDSRDFGREALDTLIAEMENHRTDLVVIMAGYTDEMETLMEGNVGLRSRMPYQIEFPNFTKDELYQIFVKMLGTKFKYSEDLLPAVKDYLDNIPDDVMQSKNFSNARFVRNLFERTLAKASMRCQLEQAEEFIVTKIDFDRSATDKEFSFNMRKKTRIGF